MEISGKNTFSKFHNSCHYLRFNVMLKGCDIKLSTTKRDEIMGLPPSISDIIKDLTSRDIGLYSRKIDLAIPFYGYEDQILGWVNLF